MKDTGSRGPTFLALNYNLQRILSLILKDKTINHSYQIHKFKWTTFCKLGENQKEKEKHNRSIKYCHNILFVVVKKSEKKKNF